MQTISKAIRIRYPRTSRGGARGTLGAAGRELHDRIENLARDSRKTGILAGIAAAVFVVLTITAVTNAAALLPFDEAMQRSIMGIREPWLNRSMIVFTFLGTRWVIVGSALVMAVWAWKTGRQRLLVTVILLAVAINPLIEHTMKELVDRPRPDLDRLLPGRGPSFPSGHVLASTSFYGMLPVLIWKTSRKVWLRLATASGALVLSLGMAFSRVYLDVHWTVDASAGFILGFVLVVITAQLHRWTERRTTLGEARTR